MKERPILMNGPMVRATLDGRKTQTRRLVKFPTQGEEYGWHPVPEGLVYRPGGSARPASPASIGDRLWVRETWAGDDGKTAHYRADGETYNAGLPWRPSIHMPRWASRITLEVTEVRIERLQDITEEDAKAEGIESCDGIPGVYLDYLETSAEQLVGTSALGSFRSLWDSIYGGDPDARWSANPWVWVTGFRRIKA